MTAWVALLRGVNVGGITIRSADLADLFRGLGLDAVRTVLASGNVAFETEDLDTAPSAALDPAAGVPQRAELKERIERSLSDRFGYDAWILLVTRAELTAAIDGFPFDASDEARQPWVIFCLDDATRDELTDAAASLDGDVDPIAAGPGVVYWNPVKGTTVGTAFAKILAKKTYKSRTTNRNLRTLEKIRG